MGTFSLNESGIHILDKTFTVDYPDSGHSDSLSFEEDSFWFKHRNQVICEVIKKINMNGNFVDVGGANGLQALFIQREFPSREVALVEPGYNGCLTAKKRGVDNVYNCMFQDFDFNAFNTDIVGMFDVVEHIEDDVSFLNELSGKLNKGNKILITVPSYNWLWSDLDDYGSHYRRYDYEMIKVLAQKTGLKIKYFSYFFSYLVPLTFLIRTIPYKIRGNRSKEEILAAENKQHKPSPILNNFFSALGKIEMKFINRSSCNFGASIIVALEVT